MGGKDDLSICNLLLLAIFYLVCLSSIILYSCPNLMLSEDEDTIIRGLSPFNKKIIIINDKKKYHSLLESQ
jgi:hypothetical protein